MSTTLTCSSTFYQCTTVPNLIENSQFFVILVIMVLTSLHIGNHTHLKGIIVRKMCVIAY